MLAAGVGFVTGGAARYRWRAENVAELQEHHRETFSKPIARLLNRLVTERAVTAASLVLGVVGAVLIVVSLVPR